MQLYNNMYTCTCTSVLVYRKCIHACTCILYMICCLLPSPQVYEHVYKTVDVSGSPESMATATAKVRATTHTIPCTCIEVVTEWRCVCLWGWKSNTDVHVFAL